MSTIDCEACGSPRMQGIGRRFEEPSKQAFPVSHESGSLPSCEPSAPGRLRSRTPAATQRRALATCAKADGRLECECTNGSWPTASSDPGVLSALHPTRTSVPARARRPRPRRLRGLLAMTGGILAGCRAARLGASGRLVELSRQMAKRNDLGRSSPSAHSGHGRELSPRPRYIDSTGIQRPTLHCGSVWNRVGSRRSAYCEGSDCGLGSAAGSDMAHSVPNPTIDAGDPPGCISPGHVARNDGRFSSCSVNLRGFRCPSSP